MLLKKRNVYLNSRLCKTVNDLFFELNTQKNVGWRIRTRIGVILTRHLDNDHACQRHRYFFRRKSGMSRWQKIVTRAHWVTRDILLPSRNPLWSRWAWHEWIWDHFLLWSEVMRASSHFWRIFSICPQIQNLLGLLLCSDMRCRNIPFNQCI